MLLIETAESTVSSELTAVILQYVHNYFLIDWQAFYCFISTSHTHSDLIVLQPYDGIIDKFKSLAFIWVSLSQLAES